MTIGNQTVQVGNETYSLVVTEEDLEKRRIERERQKRLSQETNRRRKALEDKKKLAEERESRKRSLELSKRRQRQTEATERYQRSHIATKQDKRNKLASGLKGIPSLDHVLQQLRSGSTEIVYQNRPDPNSVVSSSQLTNHGRSMFESEVQEQQRKLLEQHKQNTMQEFQQELHKDADEVQQEEDGLSDADSLEAEAPEKQVPDSFYPAYANYPSYAYSNVDIMSGRTYGPYYSVPETAQQPQTKEVSKLADSLSRLFVKQERQDSQNRPQDGWTGHEEQDLAHNTDRPQSSVQTQQYSATPTRQSAGIDVPRHVTDDRRQTFDPYARLNEDHANSQNNFDDQDSLHGSSSSGNSPVFSHMTSFQRRYFGDAEPEESASVRREKEVAGSSPGEDGSNLPYKYQSRQIVTKEDDGVNEAEPRHVTSHASVIQETSRAAPNFYIKSYRPWSATNKPENDAKQPLKRPSSAAVSRPVHPQHEREVNSDRDVIVGKGVTSVASRVDQGLLEQLEETNNRWASFTKTSATPISADYGGEAWERPLAEPSKPTTVVAKSTPAPSALPPPQPKIVIPTAFADTAPLPAPSAHAKVTFTGEAAAAGAKEGPSEAVKPKDVKGILRKTSKYGRPRSGYSPYPSYQSAAVARQQWVNHIAGTPYLKAKLNGVEVKDSIEVQRSDDGKASPKSVRWHEVQYNDGTSATISEEGGLVAKPAPVASAPLPVASVKQVSPRGGAKAARPKSAPAARSKAKPPSPKGAKKSSGGKGSRGRKLKPAKESEVAIEPHPPPAPKKKQLTMSTTINYSIPNSAGGSGKSDSKTTEGRHRVAWASAPEETVTMDTLKSSGSPEPPRPAESAVSTTKGNVVHKSGNQVTIHVTSPDKPKGGENQTEADASLQLTKTPTDEEINWLWTKVRTCLAQRPNSSRNQHPGLRKSSSDTRFGGSASARRHAWGSPQGVTVQPQQQQQASIVSIDGGLLSRENLITQQQSVIARSRGRRLIRPNSAVVTSSKQGQGSDAYGAFMRRQALLQQRRHKHFMPRGTRTDQKGVITYPSPKSSAFAPLASPSSAGGASDRMSDSTTAFLLAETLAEQNLSEEQIMRAMDSLQRRTKEAQSNGKPVMPSTLSMEEQRLLASLERLNSRLKEVESAVSTNPNVNFFNANMAYTDPDRPHGLYKPRSVSADVRYQRSRVRY